MAMGGRVETASSGERTRRCNGECVGCSGTAQRRPGDWTELQGAMISYARPIMMQRTDREEEEDGGVVERVEERTNGGGQSDAAVVEVAAGVGGGADGTNEGDAQQQLLRQSTPARWTEALPGTTAQADSLSTVEQRTAQSWELEAGSGQRQAKEMWKGCRPRSCRTALGPLYGCMDPPPLTLSHQRHSYFWAQIDPSLQDWPLPWGPSPVSTQGQPPAPLPPPQLKTKRGRRDIGQYRSRPISGWRNAVQANLLLNQCEIRCWPGI